MSKLFTAAIALLALGTVFGQQPAASPAFPAEDARLLATAKLWVTVKYFHPFLAYRDIDWDKALVEALPQIRSASNPAGYASAVSTLLAPLQDAVTAVASASAGSVAPPAPAPEGAQRSWVHRGLAPASGSPSEIFDSAFYISPIPKVQTVAIPMGGGLNATVRLSEPASASPLSPQPKPDLGYAETPYPKVEYRILALYKIWGVLHYFFAYRDLMDEDWDELLPVFLPKFIAAKDAREYNLAIAALLNHLTDSNVSVESAALSDYFGRAPVGLRVRLIEKHAVVTAITDPRASQAGIQVGDLVKTVDGDTLVTRFGRQAEYVSASTPQSLGALLLARILNGPEGSTAALTLEDRAGSRKDVKLQRAAAFESPLRTERTGDVLKLLPGKLGYADLCRMPASEVDGMFEKFRDTRAIIFDLRGAVAADTVSHIAPRLTAQADVPAAIFTGPLTLYPDIPQAGLATRSASFFFVQTLPGSDKPKYTGRIIALIDERTAGPAEHAALFLEVANKAEFIGTPSAGADSDVSNFVVPGGVTISFSGRDIRHANGGKLQRLGIQPAVTAAPTTLGIRTGKDEVLERAIRYLSPLPEKAPPARVVRS